MGVCIAPNIVAKAKHLEESSVNGRANDGITQSGGSRVVIDVDEVYSKETDATRAKGKGVVVHPFSPKGHEDRKGNTASFVDERYKGKLKGIDCRVEQDNNNSNNTILGKCSSSSEPVVVQNEGQFRTSSRRQKSAEVIGLSSCGESSNFKTMDHGRRPPRHLGSPIVVGEPSLSSRERETQSEVRDQQFHADEMLARELQEQLYNEIPEASVLGGHFPVVGGQQLQQNNTLPAPRGGRDSYTSLGLEQQLQQANNTLPVPRGGYDSNATGHFPVFVEQQLQQHNTLPAFREGDDSYSVTVLEHQLQQADNTLPVPRGGYDSNARGVVPPLNRRRQTQPQPLFRPQTQLPASTVARFRSRQHLHTFVPVGDRIGVTPSNIEWDESRRWLDIMECLEREDDLLNTGIWSPLFGSVREFNENDYEMLLGLDEINHHHLGASVSQIRNLPESIVQSEGSDTCTICLEIPTIGETIRHLPCLHKFHKACIDPWLRRKRSCPICKSDVSLTLDFP